MSKKKKSGETRLGRPPVEDFLELIHIRVRPEDRERIEFIMKHYGFSSLAECMRFLIRKEAVRVGWKDK